MPTFDMNELTKLEYLAFNLAEAYVDQYTQNIITGQHSSIDSGGVVSLSKDKAREIVKFAKNIIDSCEYEDKT